MKYINLNSDSALDYLKKYNVFLTGPPGSGKSYLLNQYIEWARQNNVKLGITASTGIAAKIINGSTLHSWSGIGLGQESKEKLLEEVESKKHKKKNWKKTQVLIIDEISMISGELWSTLDWIGRGIRKIDKPFGGLQIIAVGDFYQLPPVKGKMLIEPDIKFESYFDYGINLTQVYRSSDQKLNQILESVRSGTILNPEQTEILKSKVSSEIKYPILVSLRDSARDMNITKLNELTGIGEKYIADIYCIDTKTCLKINNASCENLKKIAFADCAMERELVLKIGAPVLYLVNDPNTGLVNGSVGTVQEFRNKNPVVKFDFTTIEITKHAYKKEFNDVTVVVEQYPLLLSYAVTIHRAQGQTLSQGTILLDKTVWEDGQAYVALSRLRSLDKLNLIKFNPKVFKVSSKVKDYYTKFTSPDENNEDKSIEL